MPGQEIGQVSGVSVRPDGSLVVLDRTNYNVKLFGRQGELTQTFGREGEAPGEFTAPIQVVALDSGVVVVQASEARTLTLFGYDGRVVDVISNPVQADWTLQKLRGPHTNDEHPFWGGAEDWARRIGPYGPTEFLYQIQEASSGGSLAYPNRPPAHLVRFNIRGGRITGPDTLMSVPALPSFEPPRLTPDHVGPWQAIPLFSSRFLWGSWGDLLAFGNGSDSTVAIIRQFTDTLLLIDWPFFTRPITETERMIEAERIGLRNLLFSAAAAARLSEMTRREQLQGIREYAEVLPFAEDSPDLTGLWLGGKCVVLAGFEPGLTALGASLSLVIVDVGRAAAGFATLPAGRRIRALGQDFLIADLIDDNGTPVLERYDLSEYCRSR